MNKKIVSIHNGITDKNLNPDMILENLKGELSGFILAGYDKEGNEYFSCSYADGGEALWLIERFKLNLLKSIDDM